MNDSWYDLGQVDQIFPGWSDVTADSSRMVVATPVPLHPHTPHRQEGGVEVVLGAQAQEKLTISFRRHRVEEGFRNGSTLWKAMGMK